MGIWKVLAIIFIIISCVQGYILYWAWNSGTEMIQLENECSVNVCAEYETYWFDSYSNLCECYIDSVLEHQEILR